MNAPLQEFVCDNCGQLINNPNEGIIEWISLLDNTNNLYINSDFKIVHQFGHSPNKNTGCSLHRGKPGLSDNNLEMFTNSNSGMSYLISLLDSGQIHMQTFTVPLVGNIREYLEIFRRVTIPHYDEARRYWSKAIADNHFEDQNEIDIYSVENLREIISKYE